MVVAQDVLGALGVDAEQHKLLGLRHDVDPGDALQIAAVLAVRTPPGPGLAELLNKPALVYLGIKYRSRP